ncbi:heparinase II/III domain-containing protein [Lacrimispora sp. 38-1]|uniref:heparinase II/III domain-containing protein n=1 Tax=Lacrimispora sp. 38-1 TaxID=3125778 RepID=UPI003CF37B60
MIQFTKAQVTQLQKKGELWPEAISQLKEEVREVMAEPILVPKNGIANWFLYYYCPKCSVQLEFNRTNGHHHKCPACGQVFTGEPYDSTWWGIINSRNYTAAFKMGLLYLVTREEPYAKKAISIMTEYSKYYKDYEVHGDIPYNGPGKSGAQTLDEANFLRSFAMTYDLMSDVMTEAEQTFIRDGMLLPGAEFLMEHRHNQLHNHEVIINSAIAIIGLIFHKDSYVKFAVYEPYGLLYQLEHGMLKNHMWFEGAFGYHFYALTSFFAYEKFALHTPHSHIGHPNYRAMMELLVDYLEPGFRIPMLNDTNYGHTSSSLYLYEFAYREIGGEKLLYILNELYKNEKRDNVEAFIYGVDEITPCSHSFENYHVEEGLSGNTILRGANQRYLLFKHDSYGGEHDHYDRLDISYLAYGKRISPDLGTTGYGALMHYDYYKNTGSHNTVMIGEENQAPVNAVLKRYEELDGMIYAEAEADWTAPYTMPDSFTIVQWKEEHYRSVKMTRKIAWTDNYFAEVFLVTGADPDLAIDWVMHVSGENISAFNGQPVEGFSENKPYKHLHSIRKTKADNLIVTAYQDGEVTTHIFGYGFGQTVFSAKGPDNPSVSDINFRIERSFGGEAMFAHVITSSDGACKVDTVSFEVLNGSMMIHVKEADGGERKLIV